MIATDIKLKFSDVAIVPKISKNITSRKQVNLETTITDQYGNSIIGIPIIASNMYSTGTFEMAKALAKLKCFTALHKHYPIEELDRFCTENIDILDYVFFSAGLQNGDLENIQYLIQNGHNIKNICLDVANGYIENFRSLIHLCREKHPNWFILAGNVSTRDGAKSLLDSGASIVKAGIASGNFCRTRNVTGIYKPQFSLCYELSDILSCSDGGCIEPGDLCKAFGVGSNMVMLGSMLVGTDECDGEWEYNVKIPECPYTDEYGQTMGKITRKALRVFGMASQEANEELYGEMKDYKASEGACEVVPYKGSVEIIMKNIFGGLRSACTYTGYSSLNEFIGNVDFIKI